MRVWLGGLRTSDSRTLAAYRAWRRDTGWPTMQRLNRHGGFTALKREAEAANAVATRAGGGPVSDGVLARAGELIAAIQAQTTVERNARLQLARGVAARSRPTATSSAPSFADALAAVLAGPHGEAQPPKQ